ncbi:hypothetical protein QF035_000585 [Streptomyces umbrinus]|uniref:Uncharacterized protein n=1 Tax=Streptomyces umbrinus TaxID=67370 RepID=A0ABU0SHP4_9ACTN|nr:hypothetical protein [Streptomyces umbrinus]MDQ1023003.1 hypothetical protein [Streptomyces umbrinus]
MAISDDVVDPAEQCLRTIEYALKEADCTFVRALPPAQPRRLRAVLTPAPRPLRRRAARRHDDGLWLADPG